MAAGESDFKVSNGQPVRGVFVAVLATASHIVAFRVLSPNQPNHPLRIQLIARKQSFCVGFGGLYSRLNPSD